MPTYVYKFTDTGETIEVQQAFTDATLTEYPHPADGTVRSVKKVFMPVGVTFKGSGFYKNDSRGSGSKASSGSSSATSTDTSSSSTSTGSGESSSSSTTAPAAASSSSSATPAPAAGSAAAS